MHQKPLCAAELKRIPLKQNGVLDEEVVVAKIATTTQHGAMQDKTQTIPTNYYNLDAIISVGYRVNSIQATRFRI